MEEEIFEFSSLEVKEEPPEEFVLTLLPPDDDLTAPQQYEEDDVAPQADAKEESQQEDCLLVLLPTTLNDESQQARNRKRIKNHSTGAFTNRKQPKPIHICAICDVKFSRKLLLNRHQNEFHEAVFECKIFECDICDKRFSNPYDLKSHQNAVHDKSKVKCEECGKICRNRILLREHRKSHIKVECKICYKIFKKTSMLAHLQTHSAEKPFQCDLCDFSTKLKNSLNGHIERKHLEKKCLICDANFSCQLLHDRHQNELHGDVLKCDVWKCETCPKAYARKNALAKHQKQKRHGIHANDPHVSFVCDKCNKLFPSPNHLRAHQKSFHDEIKVECKVCRKICKNRKALCDHRRIHIKAECSICLNIISKPLMAEHMQRHAANTFECDLCEYSAQLKESIKRHIERKHLVVFTKHQALWKHQRQHRHGIYKTFFL